MSATASPLTAKCPNMGTVYVALKNTPWCDMGARYTLREGGTYGWTVRLPGPPGDDISSDIEDWPDFFMKETAMIATAKGTGA